MVTQNETYTSTVVPYSPDILDDLPIDDQLAVEFSQQHVVPVSNRLPEGSMCQW